MKAHYKVTTLVLLSLSYLLLDLQVSSSQQPRPRYAKKIIDGIETVEKFLSVTKGLNEVVKTNEEKFADVNSALNGLLVDYEENKDSIKAQNIKIYADELKDNLLAKMKTVILACEFNRDELFSYRRNADNPKANFSVEYAAEWRKKTYNKMLNRSLHESSKALGFAVNSKGDLEMHSSRLATLRQHAGLTANKTMAEVQESIQDGVGVPLGQNFIYLGKVGGSKMSDLERATMVMRWLKEKQGEIDGFFAKVTDYTQWLLSEIDFINETISQKGLDLGNVTATVELLQITDQDIKDWIGEFSASNSTNQTYLGIDVGVDKIVFYGESFEVETTAQERS